MASSFCSEAYLATDPAFDGRVTVPVLWDKETRRIVNNSEDDICRMFNGAFRAPSPGATSTSSLPTSRTEHDETRQLHLREGEQRRLRAGFASQAGAPTNAPAARSSPRSTNSKPGSHAALPVRRSHRRGRLAALLHARPLRRGLSRPLQVQPAPHRRLPAILHGYSGDLYQQPGIAETVNFDHIKRHYYLTHDDINPTRIVPIGPVLDSHPPARPREAVGKISQDLASVGPQMFSD